MIRYLLPVVMVLTASWARLPAAELVGVTVTPHTVAESMRYRRPRDPDLAARVQLFVTGPARPTTFAGRTPAELLQEGEWAWHDLATAVKVPEEALTVWTFNGKSSRWGVGQEFELQAEGLTTRTVPIPPPQRWISAVTFLAPVDQIYPDTIVLHVANDGDQPLAVSSLRLWLPREQAAWHTLWPQEPLAAPTVIPARDRGFVKLRAGSALPLTYAALELSTDAGPIWTHLRIKREVFDISGGWVNESLTEEAYLGLLARLHVNTGQIQTVPGYTDNPALYQRYPLKLFNRLWPLDQWDTDDWLPKIHAVEFLGEPQYGGGRPVPPQAVFDQLLPYRAGRLATSVTHSEERVWRYYAGLSDFPHYDAYRVVAPAADSWRDYDRWGGQRISWGAPLETIGDMCRSLRELNRPMPCAYWSQGPHSGWGGGLFGGGRARRSPTPDELRSQAVHALSTRITSLYWFNLSLKSLLKYPDTWEPITRIGREIRMLEPFYLAGDAYRFERRTRTDGSPDWDLASIAAPDAAVLFALDTAYAPDPQEHVFQFGEPREVSFSFDLPPWLRQPRDLFRVDADGLHEVPWHIAGQGVAIDDKCRRDAIYVATTSQQVRGEIEERRKAAQAREEAFPVNLMLLEELKK